MTEKRTRLNALPFAYPRLFRAGALPFSFEHGEGWCELVEALCSAIDTVLLEESNAEFSILQVKEKFGSLRFYCRHDGISQDRWERIKTIIRTAEEASTHLCERCGQGAQLNDRHGLLATLCASCNDRQIVFEGP